MFLATKPVALLNTTTEMQTCWMNSFTQLLMNIPSFVSHFINQPIPDHPDLQLIYNLVRKFIFVPKKLYSLTHSRIARYDVNCFTVIIPSEMMEFLEKRKIFIGTEEDSGFKLRIVLKELMKLDPGINFLHYQELQMNETPRRTNKTELYRLMKPTVPHPYDYPLEGLRGILLFEPAPPGHWNAFIRSIIDDKWRKFNDQEVSIIEDPVDLQNRGEAIILCYDPLF